MTSYKVRCGTLRETVLADSPSEAGWKALEANDSKPGRTTLGPYFEVKPRGGELVIKLTEKVLRETGRLLKSDSESNSASNTAAENGRKQAKHGG
jgi:hypothetical protein